jgi:hypothetical protein
MAFPLSRDSTAAKRSRFFSTKSASLTSSFPRPSGVTFFHEPSNAFRAAATAISTSFSVASWTEVITSSVEGLITSNVLPSTPLTNSLLMNLVSKRIRVRAVETCWGKRVEATYSPVGWVYLPVEGVVSSIDKLMMKGFCK